MKTSLRLLLSVLFLASGLLANAQLFNKLVKKSNKPAPQSEEAALEAAKPKVEEYTVEQEQEQILVAEGKHFTFRHFTLNTDVTRAEIDSFLKLDGLQPITEMQYYMQGEDLRFIDKTKTNVTLRFDDDTPRLIGIYVEDIENITLVHQLEAMVANQMGDPTMGYELMKNYDGASNTGSTDYSTYEYIYRYVIGMNVYDFEVEQFGAKTKKGKIIHPYNFSATVNKKSEVALKASKYAVAAEEEEYDNEGNPIKKKKSKEKTDDEKLKENFYPPVGVQQFGAYTVESRILKKW